MFLFPVQGTFRRQYARSLLVVVFAIMYIPLYTEAVYRRPAQTYGGGASQVALLKPQDPQLMAGIEAAISPIKVHGLSTEPVLILLADSDYITVARFRKAPLPFHLRKKMCFPYDMNPGRVWLLTTVNGDQHGQRRLDFLFSPSDY